MSSRSLMSKVSKVIDVGVPPPSFRDDQSIMVHFHNFAGLPSNKGSYEETGPFELFNCDWNVLLYPGGTEAASSDDTVSIGLHFQSKGEICIRYLYIVRDPSGEIIRETGQRESTFDNKKNTWTIKNFLSRSTVIEKALDSTLTIELRMLTVIDSKSKYCKYFVPANRVIRQAHSDKQGSIISGLLFDEESADVCFDVSSPSVETIPSVKVYAHRNILKARAPDLFRLCAGYDVSHSMPIDDVEPKIFRELMHYIYGLQMNYIDWEEDAKALLEAANKYDIANLKVTAEAWYITYFEFTAENVVDQLLYADAMSCPLLKEAALKFIVRNGINVFSSDSFKTVLEDRSITLQILQTMAKKLEYSADSAGVDSMSIDDLRIRLDEYRFAVDGDREMLIRRFVDLVESIDESEEEQDQSTTADDQNNDAEADDDGADQSN